MADSDASFPIPLTPPVDPSAHAVEVHRALAAEKAAKDAPLVISDLILYEDEWIVVLSKPAGRYCEDVLAAVDKFVRHEDDVKQIACIGGMHEVGMGEPQRETLQEEKKQTFEGKQMKETASTSTLKTQAHSNFDNFGSRAISFDESNVKRCPIGDAVHMRPQQAKLLKQKRRLKKHPERSEVTPAAYMVHRLDRDTSGVQIVAKTKQAAAAFMKIFAGHEVKKTYLALGCGPCLKWSELNIRTGHGRSRHGMFRVYSENDVGRPLPGGKAARVQVMESKFEVLGVSSQQRLRAQTWSTLDETMSSECYPGGDPQNGQQSTAAGSGHPDIERGCQGPLSAKGVADFDKQNSDKYSDMLVLLRCHPLTGRTHQIRLHCLFLSLPLVGDARYGGLLSVDGEEYAAHCLHAESLLLKHPFSANMLHLKARKPSWADFLTCPH